MWFDFQTNSLRYMSVCIKGIPILYSHTHTHTLTHTYSLACTYNRIYLDILGPIIFIKYGKYLQAYIRTYIICST